MTLGPDNISNLHLPTTDLPEVEVSNLLAATNMNGICTSDLIGGADATYFIGAMNNVVKGFSDAVSTTQRELIAREIQKFLTIQSNAPLFEAKDLNTPQIKAIEPLQQIYKVVKETTSKAFYNTAVMNVSINQGALLDAQQKILQQMAMREVVSILMGIRAARASQKQKKPDPRKIGTPGVLDIDGSTC